jgi:RNA polymerase sigma factor (sigma-70 family)
MDATHRQDDSDSALMASVAAGELPAFERLFDIYHGRVYHYVRTLVHEPTMAEEVAGDTMMAVWRGASTYGRGSRVSTWIFGIARHKALDALRRLGRHQCEVDLVRAAELPDTGTSALDGVQRTQVTSLTQRALNTLSADHQEILRLVFYEALPYGEIAALLAIPVNTVKTRVYYAKQQLKQQLERLGPQELLR